MLSTMKELGFPISIEDHLNPIIESCLRAGKVDKINDIVTIMSIPKAFTFASSSL